MLQCIEGHYKNGRIDLAEIPADIREANVIVTFLPPIQQEQKTASEVLRQKFLSRLEQGIDFGSAPLPTREEIYADRIDRYR